MQNDNNLNTVNVPIKDYDALQSELKKSKSEVAYLKDKIKEVEREFRFLSIAHESSEKVREYNKKATEKRNLYNKLVLANCPVGILYFDQNMKYILGTDVSVKQLGYDSYEELIGLDIFDCFSRAWTEDLTNKLVSVCRRAMKTLKRECYYTEVSFFGHGGYANIHVSPIFSNDDYYQGVVIVIEDSTSLYEMKNKAEKSSNAKKDFLSNMSHEIRTPMNAIKGISELLLLSEQDKIKQDHLGSIINASNSIIKIINDILDFSKIDGDKIEFAIAPFDVYSFLSDISNIVSARATDKKIDFFTDFDPDIPASISGDDLRLKQVLLNILNNAINFTDEGYICLKVDSSLNSDKSKVTLTFSVEDTGIGIKSEDLPQLFDAYIKLDSLKNAKQEGTGLGLAISKRLVEMMNSEINVSSVYGKGSVFSFTITLDVTNSQPIAAVSEPETKHCLVYGNTGRVLNVVEKVKRLHIKCVHAASEEELEHCLRNGGFTNFIYFHDEASESLTNGYKLWLQDVKTAVIKNIKMTTTSDVNAEHTVLIEPVIITTLSKLFNSADENTSTLKDKAEKIGGFKIKDGSFLVVDDNEINLMVCIEILKHYDTAAVVATNGHEAVTLCAKKKFDFIFMDHMMPEMDGIEATREIRRSGENTATPIIALTANAVSGVREIFVDAGMNDYISKPIDVKEFNRVLLEFLPMDKIEFEIEDERTEITIAPEATMLGDELAKALQALGIDYGTAIQSLANNADVYKSILATFVKSLPNKLAKMDELLQISDINSFRIEVHGLKSALSNLGDRANAKLARTLEFEAEELRTRHLIEMYPKLRGAMENIYNKLVEAFKRNSNDNEALKQQGSLKLLENSLNRTKEYLNNLEADCALETIKNASKYRYTNNIDVLLNEVLLAIDNFDYDMSGEYLDDILKLI